MSKHLTIAASAFAALSALALSSPAAAAIDETLEPISVTDLGGGDYSFVQGGFDEGAQITGSFSGIDGNGDNLLVSFPGPGGFNELTAFSVSFSGNSLVDAFTLDLGDLFIFSYFLGGDFSLAFEGVAAGTPSETEAEFGFLYQGGGFELTCNVGGVCGQVIQEEAEVPAPAMLGLLGLGVAGLAAARRRRAA